MGIKALIADILRDNNATFSMLAEAIGMSESELNESLQENCVQLRTLELISRELRVPLYSFFRDSSSTDLESLQNMEKYYTTDISRYREKELLREIEKLREQVKNLQNKLEKIKLPVR
jgi:transcriptional regulator with XRE-family HTH domain